MIEQIVLTKDEYNDLLDKQQEPSDILRRTNKELQKKYDELKLSKVGVTIDRINSPFKIVENSLQFNSKGDFVAFYNYFSSRQESKRVSLKETDKLLYEYMTEMCSVFGYDLPFSTLLGLKRYRTALVKNGLYKLDRNNILNKEE